MKAPAYHQITLFAGLLFLLMGLQMRAVESYTLSPGTTRRLAHWAGPPASTPKGAVQRMVVETASVRKTITPPPWLGWATLSLGAVLTAHGLFLQSRK